jgi:hypothetical protein
VDDFQNPHPVALRLPDLVDHQSPGFVQRWQTGFHIVCPNRIQAGASVRSPVYPNQG